MAIRLSKPVQWMVVGGIGILCVGLAGSAVAAPRRRGSKTPDDSEPKAPTDPSLQWRQVTPADPGYPWEFPALHYENYPTPGTWLNASDRSGAFDPSEGFDRFVQALLGSALAMAGNDPRIATATGQQANADLGRRLRKEVRESLIIVGGINDLLYGQTNLNFAGGNDPNKPGGNVGRPIMASYVLNSQGRGLDWLPRHADNLERIRSGEPLKRTTALDGSRLSSPNRGSRQMLIWAPAYDMAALSPNTVPSIQYLRWSDGSSTIDPPPIIRASGVDMSGVRLPGVEEVLS